MNTHGRFNRALWITGLLALGLVIGCSSGEKGDAAQSDGTEAVSKGDSFGEGITLASSMPIAKLLSDPEPLEGKMVQVEGTVETVCPMAGCWMDIESDGKMIRIKVNDGDIVFPQEAAGKHAVAEGILEKLELDMEEARGYKKHEAEEKGETFDPATVTEGMTLWRIKGTGAVVGG